MPSVVITVPPFPNVPALPGVPQLVRSVLAPANPAPVAGTSALQQQLWASSQSAPVWGIFDANMNRVVTPDSVLNFDNRNEWRIPDYPLQDGAFAPYNKIIVPFDVTVRLTKGGTQAGRKAMLDQIAGIAGDLNFYSVLTPERTYSNVNVVRYEVTRRGAGGAFFLDEVDVFLRQVNTIVAQYSTTVTNTVNAQNPSAVPPANQGAVQPQTPQQKANFIAASALAQQVM